MFKIPKQEYTAEFKELAVERVRSGQGIAAVARELGLVEQTLRNWVKAAKVGKLHPPRGRRRFPQRRWSPPACGPRMRTTWRRSLTCSSRTRSANLPQRGQPVKPGTAPLWRWTKRAVARSVRRGAGGCRGWWTGR